ncbi:MAG: prolyl oligopeptidase family serine peptidase [Thermomicrobiales bacterium]
MIELLDREVHQLPADLARLLTPEELADRLIPSSPRISPDGKQAAFVVAPAGQKDEQETSAIWIAAGHESARQLTAGTACDRAPRWSPDGRQMLFLSNRDAKDKDKDKEDSQIYLLPMHGGEACRFSQIAGELSQPAWSPDGESIAVLRRDPEPDEVKARRKERDDAVVVEEDPRFARLWLVDVASEQSRILSVGEREVRCFCWLPDGSAIVAVTTDDIGHDATIGESDLWLVPVDGSGVRLISHMARTGESPQAIETSDGVVIALVADGFRDHPEDSIWIVPLAGGESQNLLPDFDGIVESIVPRPGRPGTLVARVVERTHGRLYEVDVSTGIMTQVTPPSLQERGSIISGPSIAADGSSVALIWSDGTTPEEVCIGALNGDVSVVTSFGVSFAGRLQPVEHVRWLSDDGVEIEGLLTYPIGYVPGQRYPLVVEIHGGPSWQWEDRVMLDWHDWAQLLASRGFAVLMPNPRGSTGYGDAFQKLLQDDVGGGESRDLVAGALSMVERGIADRDRLGIAGWSWGGYLTAWTITQTDIFRAAVMGAGLSNMISDHGQGDIPTANLLYYPGQPYHEMEHYWASSPIRYVANVKTPTLIVHGDEDARVHPAQGMEFFRALKVLGVPVRFVRYPREKHGFVERAHQIDLMNRILDWFERYLKPDAGATD